MMTEEKAKASFKDFIFTIIVFLLILRFFINNLANADEFPSFEFLMTAFGFAALSLALSVRKVQIAIPLRILILILVGLCLVSALRAPVKWSALLTLLHIASSFSFFFSLLIFLGETENARPLLYAFLALMVVVVLYGAYQSFFLFDELETALKEKPDLVVEGEWLRKAVFERVVKREAFSLFVLPNGFSAFCAMVLFFCGAAFIEKLFSKDRRDSAFAASILCVGASATGIYLSGAKGGISVLIFVCLLGLLWRISKRISHRFKFLRNPYLLPAGAVILSMLIVGTIVLLVPPERLPPSASVRAMYWRSGLSMVQDNPCGVGLGNFQHFYSIYKDIRAEDVKYAHNLLVTFGVEAGPLATVFLLLLVFVVWRAMAREWQKIEPKKTNRMKFLFGALGGVLALLVAFVLSLVGGGGSNIPSVLVILFFIWLLMFFLLWRADFLADFKRWQPSVVGAFFVGLFSCFIDFNAYEGPFAFSLLLFSALGLSLSGAVACDEVRKKRDVVYVGGCGIAAVIVALFIPNIMETDILRARGDGLVEEGRRLGGKEGGVFYLVKGVELLNAAAGRTNLNFYCLRDRADASLHLYRMRHTEAERCAAIAAYEHLFKANPRDAIAHKIVSSLYEQGQESEKALAHIKKALELRPVEPRYWLEYGRMVWKFEGNKAKEEAEKAFRRALQLNDTPGAWNKLLDEEHKLAVIMLQIISENAK
jgi:hypothetical protein